MSSVVTEDDPRRRRRTAAAVKDSLRRLSNQISLLNHQVSAQAELKDVDLDCFDLISRHGPLSPSALGRSAGLHPATVTGILDRLQRGGWISRDRDPDDRRAVTVRAVPERARQVYRLYGGMNDAMDAILAGYTDDQLDLVLDFLRRATAAGGTATERLAAR